MGRSEGPTQLHYVHRLDYSIQERMVGIFILVALTLIFTLVFMKGRAPHLFEEKVFYYVYLKNAQGVSTETMVTISGIQVGRVKSLDITEDNRIKLTFFVYKRFHGLIRADSKAALSKLSLLGSATLEIQAGSTDRVVIPAESVLPVEEPKSLDELIAEVTPVVDQLKQTIEGVAGIVKSIDPMGVKNGSESLTAALENVKTASEKVTSKEGTLGQLIFSAELYHNLSGSIAVIHRGFEQMDMRLAELKPVIQNVQEVSGSTKEVMQDMPELVADIKTLVGQLNVAMSIFNVELQRFPDLVTRMKVLIDETNRTVEGLQRVWPLASALGTTEENVLVAPAPVH